MQNTVPRALVGFSIGFDSNSPQVLVVAKMDGPSMPPPKKEIAIQYWKIR